MQLCYIFDFARLEKKYRLCTSNFLHGTEADSNSKIFNERRKIFISRKLAAKFMKLENGNLTDCHLLYRSATGTSGRRWSTVNFSKFTDLHSTTISSRAPELPMRILDVSTALVKGVQKEDKIRSDIDILQQWRGKWKVARLTFTSNIRKDDTTMNGKQW
jgi:hypothetical protein